MLLGDKLLISEILQFVHQAPAWIQQRACWPTLNCLDCHRLCVASRLRQRLAPGLSQVLWSMDDIVALVDAAAPAARRYTTKAKRAVLAAEDSK